MQKISNPKNSLKYCQYQKTSEFWPLQNMVFRFSGQLCSFRGCQTTIVWLWIIFVPCGSPLFLVMNVNDCRPCMALVEKMSQEVDTRKPKFHAVPLSECRSRWICFCRISHSHAWATVRSATGILLVSSTVCAARRLHQVSPRPARPPRPAASLRFRLGEQWADRGTFFYRLSQF